MEPGKGCDTGALVSARSSNCWSVDMKAIATPPFSTRHLLAGETLAIPQLRVNTSRPSGRYQAERVSEIVPQLRGGKCCFEKVGLLFVQREVLVLR